MTTIIGFFVVIGCVIGGYLFAGGNLSVLFQPAEVMVIGGAAIGAFIISSPKKLMKNVIKGAKKTFKFKSHSKDDYIQLLSLLYGIFLKMRKEGILAIEGDVESPEKSAIFKKYESILHNERAVSFICDNMKVMLSIEIQPHEIENLMDIDIESSEEEEIEPAHAINKMADGLPGLGIVAAVMGIVVTMGMLNEPPEILGHHIGAALVGTFMGVLLCYGFVGPFAALIENQVKEEASYYQVIKIAIVSYMTSSAPQIAVEFGRRAIPESLRPTFSELEKILKGK